MTTITSPAQTPPDGLSQPLEDGLNNDIAADSERLEDDLQTIEKEQGSPSFKERLAPLGLMTLTVSQYVTLGLGIFASIPLILSLFLGVTYSPILSDSMKPTFETGDVVLTRTAIGGELHPGAIVQIKDKSRTYTHRVVSVNEDGSAITKGDANNITDVLQPTDADLAGVVTHVIKQPFATTISLFWISDQWMDTAGTLWAGIWVWDWSAAPSLLVNIPTGFLSLLAALILTWWLIPDWISWAQKRRARREAAEFAALTRTVAAHDDSITEIEPVVREFKAERKADREARAGAEGSFWSALNSADDDLSDLIPATEKPVNVFGSRTASPQTTRSVFDLDDE